MAQEKYTARSATSVIIANMIGTGVFASLGFQLLEIQYKTFLYPFTPILYLCLMGWTLIYIIKEKPNEAIMSLAVIVLGILMYFVSKLKK